MEHSHKIREGGKDYKLVFERASDHDNIILSNVDIYDEIAVARNRNGLLLEESVA